MSDISAGHVLLLVEDDHLLQIDAEEALTSQGFQVVTASSGSEAFEELEKGADRFSAIVTDIRLGSGPNGWDIGHRSRELLPTVPVVYMTGDSAQEWTAHGVPNSLLLQKPFVPAQLITAVTSLLNQAPTLGLG